MSSDIADDNRLIRSTTIYRTATASMLQNVNLHIFPLSSFQLFQTNSFSKKTPLACYHQDKCVRIKLRAQHKLTATQNKYRTTALNQKTIKN